MSGSTRDVHMFDVGGLTATITCPECSFTNTIRLKQVELEQQIICEGCLKSIQLRDADKSSSRAIDDIESALRDLDDTLERGFR